MIRVVVLYMPKVSMISYFFSRHKVFYGSVALLFLIGALRFHDLATGLGNEVYHDP